MGEHGRWPDLFLIRRKEPLTITTSKMALQGNEFSVKSSYSQDGILYFGGINGLTLFRPSDGEASGDGESGLRMVDFYVNGKPVHAGDRSGHYTIIDRWFPMVDEVNLFSSRQVVQYRTLHDEFQ